MALVSVTLVMEALAIGGGRFKWLAGRTTVSSVVTMVKLRGAVDLVDIWNGVSVLVLFQELVLFFFGLHSFFLTCRFLISSLSGYHGIIRW